MTERILLDQLRVGDGWVRAIKAERYLLETSQGDLVLRSEEQLRAEFLKQAWPSRDSHHSECTGWCQCEVLRLAHAARAAMERAWPEFPRMYCENASTALALILRRHGYPARVVQGWVKLDRPIDLDGEPEDSPSHQWVEAGGLWVDLTADQFDPEHPPVLFYEAGPIMGHHAEGVPPSVHELEADPEVLALVDEVADPYSLPDDGGDVTRAYQQYRARRQNYWGLAWYLAWEFCHRFYSSHGIVPKVLEHEGLGYYGIGLFTTECGVHGTEKQLGRFSVAGRVEGMNCGIPDMVERALSGEPLPFLVRDAIRCFGLPPYPAKSHLTCKHKRWAESYLLLFQIAALLAIRHEGELRIWNHQFHTDKWGRKHDSRFGQKEHPGYFLFEPHNGRRVLVAGDGRLILPYQGTSLWERYMAGESVAELAGWLEHVMTIWPTGDGRK